LTKTSRARVTRSRRAPLPACVRPFLAVMFWGQQDEPRVEQSQYSHSQMVVVHESELMEREGTAELKNDPRFFTENVIDKRLAAFEAMAIITTLLSEEAVEQCFELTNHFSWTGGMIHVCIIQLVGFFMMVATMFLSTMATGVLSLQLFFTIRLMTAGPTGFDKAARFYQDKRMWRWRERAIFGVKWGLVLFVCSTGFMLYVKFYTEGAPELEHEPEEVKEEEYTMHSELAAVVLGVFVLATGALIHLVRQHQSVFDECYSTLDACFNELNRHLVTERA